MRFKNIFFAAAAAMALTACSSDDVVQAPNTQALQTSQAIGFSPLSKGSTRSSVINSIGDITSFKVRGTWAEAVTTTDRIFINGTEVTPAEAHNIGDVYQGFGTGLEIVQNNGAWNYKNSSETQYWPFKASVSGESTITAYNCLELNFNAVTPVDAITLTSTNSYTHTTPTVADMTDICYAEANNQTNAVGQVKLNFKHILSQIVVKAKKADGYTVDIKKVTIGGVGTTATTTNLSDIAANGSNSQILWGDASSPSKFDAYGASNAYSVAASAADEKPVKITPAGQELLLIPQRIEAWAPDGGTKATESNKGYIAIEYRAKKSTDAAWATGTANDGYKTVYYPLTAAWYPGKVYNYTLLFGGVSDPDDDGSDTDNPDPGTGGDNPGGYDESGNPEAPSVPITFTATVLDWESSTVDITF